MNSISIKNEKFDQNQKIEQNIYSIIRANDYISKNTNPEITLTYQATNSKLNLWDNKEGYMMNDKNGIFVEGTPKCNLLVQNALKELGGVDIKVKNDGNPNTYYLLDKTKSIQNGSVNMKVDTVKDIKSNLPPKQLNITVKKSQLNTVQQKISIQEKKAYIITYKNDNGKDGHTLLQTRDGTTLQAKINSPVEARNDRNFNNVNSENKATLRQVKTEEKMVDFEEKQRKIDYQWKEVGLISLSSNAGTQLVHILNGNKNISEAAIDLTKNTTISIATSYACNYIDQTAKCVPGKSSKCLGIILLIWTILINVSKAKTCLQAIKCVAIGGLNMSLNYAVNLIGGVIGIFIGGPGFIGKCVGSFIGGIFGGLINSDKFVKKSY